MTTKNTYTTFRDWFMAHVDTQELAEGPLLMGFNTMMGQIASFGIQHNANYDWEVLFGKFSCSFFKNTWQPCWLVRFYDGMENIEFFLAVNEKDKIVNITKLPEGEIPVFFPTTKESEMVNEDKSKAQVSSLLAGYGVTSGGNEMITVKLTPEYLGRLSLIYGDEVKNLMVTCIQRTSFEGADNPEDVISVEVGKQYRLHGFNSNKMVLELGPKRFPSLNNWDAGIFFQMELPRSQYDLIENQINNHSAMRMRHLDELAGRFLTKNQFKLGEKVRWKSGLRDRPRPYDGEYAIIVEILETPITYRNREKRESVPSTGAVEDIVYAILDGDGDFLHYLGDSRRFEPVDEA